MVACKARLLIVLGVALIPAAALALSPPPPPPPDSTQTVVDDAEEFDADAWQEKRERAERELFDALRADASPRRQVLAGRIHLSDEDQDTPAALRPKRDDVVARAANLAPDDAFVQWAAASQCNYYSSQCGPTRWPEAEVANLLRLEPDNAAAWQFAVALAQVKADQPGLDQALSRMAAARRADDHVGEEVALWSQVYTTYPDAAAFPFGADDTATPPSNALRVALHRTAFRFSSTASAIENACKPDGSTEQSWQRIGWCADAGTLLATKGNSLELRELGLKMLAASGSTADSAELQRQYDWLYANGGITSMYSDTPADLLADWQGAASEIEATERRLARLGKPPTAPAGWVKGGHDDGESDAQGAAMATALSNHAQALVDDLRASADVRERALGLASRNPFANDAGQESADARAPDPAALAQLAATHSDQLLVQWLAAGDDTHAIDETLQRLDPDNAAVWALSLDRSGSDAAATTRVLTRMANATRHATPEAEILGLWLDVGRRHPPSPELVEEMSSMEHTQAIDGEAAGRGLAMMMASMTMPARTSSIEPACGGSDKQVMAARRDACIGIGRLLLHSSGSSSTADSGERVLRKLGAFDARDSERARQLAWWRNAVRQRLMGDSDQAINAYIDDLLVTGSDIEALRLAADRLGKGTPPADWQSPTEKRAVKALKSGD
jgi:hypothetical protein